MTEAWLLSGLAVVVIAAAWMFRSEARADQTPPPTPERPPAEHEVKTALADMRAALDRLHGALERRSDHHDDELRAIQRQLDRIEGSRRAEESDRRLEDLLSRIARQQKET